MHWENRTKNYFHFPIDFETHIEYNNGTTNQRKDETKMRLYVGINENNYGQFNPIESELSKELFKDNENWAYCGNGKSGDWDDIERKAMETGAKVIQFATGRSATEQEKREIVGYHGCIIKVNDTFCSKIKYHHGSFILLKLGNG